SRARENEHQGSPNQQEYEKSVPDGWLSGLRPKAPASHSRFVRTQEASCESNHLVIPQAAHLSAFSVKMVLGEGDRVEDQILCHAGEFGDFGEHFLPRFGMAGNRSHPFAFFQRNSQGGIKEKHEFHRSHSFRGPSWRQASRKSVLRTYNP